MSIEEIDRYMAFKKRGFLKLLDLVKGLERNQFWLERLEFKTELTHSLSSLPLNLNHSVFLLSLFSFSSNKLAFFSTSFCHVVYFI